MTVYIIPGFITVNLHFEAKTLTNSFLYTHIYYYRFCAIRDIKLYFYLKILRAFVLVLLRQLRINAISKRICIYVSREENYSVRKQITLDYTLAKNGWRFMTRDNRKVRSIATLTRDARGRERGEGANFTERDREDV